MKFDYKREEKIRSVAGGGWGFCCLFYCEKIKYLNAVVVDGDTEHRLENESIVEHGLKEDRSWTTEV